jgi:hypothetical protein
MIQRIYVPTNFVVPEIIGNISEECKNRGYELIRIDEKTLSEHMLLNRGALALMSPYSYGLGVKQADYRIIPTYAASLVSYTGKASLYFNSGLSTIEKVGTGFPEDFIMRISKIILSERYELDVKLEKSKDILKDILLNYPAAIQYGREEDIFSMDISEDWFESFEIPLPVGFWVTRNEEEPEDVISFTNSFALDELPEEIPVKLYEKSGNDEILREGSILTRWNSDIKSALEQTLELLYYHRLLPEIPAVKIYNID